jgi:hypothetical protein
MNKLIKISIVSLLFFYVSWWLAQYIAQETKEGIFSKVFFSFIFTCLSGCLIPVLIKNSFAIAYNQKPKNRLIGWIFIVVTVLSGVFGSGAFIKFIELDYSFLIFLKYVLLFFNMSLAISFFAFLIIPELLKNISLKSKGIITVLAIGLFLFIGFEVDTLFRDTALSITMGIMGLLFGIAYYFLKNFWIVFFALFINILINTLSENKYDDYPFWILVLSCVLSISIILFEFKQQKINKTNN